MKHGQVSSIETTDDGLHLVTVVVSRAGVTYEKCPVLHSFSGEVQTLGEGSHVVIEKTDDGLWVVVGVLSTDEGSLPSDLESQERVIAFEDGTEFSITKDRNGDYNIDVAASGNVTINADGQVTIGDADNAVELAVQDHQHEYTGDGGHTRLTSPPLGEGTTTQVE